MKNIENVLFDMDQTLVDSGPYYSEVMWKVIDEEARRLIKEIASNNPEYKKFVNQDPPDEIVKTVVFSRANLIEALVHQELIDSDSLKEKIVVYPQIPEVLEQFRDEGKKLFVVSGTTEKVVKHVIDQVCLNKFFDGIHGYLGITDNSRLGSKAAITWRVMEEHKLPAEKTAIIGDDKGDMVAGRELGIYPIAALWGAKKPYELRQGGARSLVERPEDLLTLKLA